MNPRACSLVFVCSSIVACLRACLSIALLGGLLGLAGCVRPAGEAPRLISYPVGDANAGYSQLATLYVPKGPAQRHPAVVVLHGGFYGDDSTTDHVAAEITRRGALSAFPAYRGEKRRLDGQYSKGSVEFCEGEVRDALALVAYLRKRPDVDPTRIAFYGFSHGGCIALRTLAKDHGLDGGVAFSPPSELGDVREHIGQNPLQLAGAAGIIGAQMQGYVGAKPEDRPGLWVRRSPLYEAQYITAPLLVIHGLNDELVPYKQSCRLLTELAHARPVTVRVFTRSGYLISGAPSPCPLPVSAAQGPGAQQKAAPPAEFWFYQGQGHLFTQPGKDRAQSAAVLRVLRMLK